VLAVVGALLLVGTVFALVLGLRGTSPGKSAFALRVLDPETGRPIGVGRAFVRTTILGLGTLPMFGLGTAILAWTAVEDPSGTRRGWHDHVAHSLVVDVRPVEVAEAIEDERPRQVVNLTAMRLMPVRQQPATVPVVPASAPASNGGRGSPVPAHRPPAPAPDAAVREPRTPATPLRPLTPAPAPSDFPRVPAADRPETAASARGRHSAGPGPATGPPSAGATAPRRTTWRVSFDSGESFVVEGLGLVGRRPEGRAGEPVRHVVPLVSQNMSISKTHAQFHLAGDGALVVMDRGSTNGSILVRRGVSRELSAGRPATLLDGDRVMFGDREMRVSRDED
jgi:hypothetical protein